MAGGRSGRIGLRQALAFLLRQRRLPTPAEVAVEYWRATGRLPLLRRLSGVPGHPPPGNRRSRGGPTRVLLVSHNLNREGAPRVLLQLARELAKDPALRLSLASPHDGPLRASFEAAGIAVHVWPELAPRLLGRRAFLRAVGSLLGRLRAQDVDVVVANTLHAVLGLAAAQRAGLPWVWAIHESVAWAPYMARFGLSCLEEAAAAFHGSGTFVFVSAESQALYPLSAQARSHLIPNRLPAPDVPELPTTAQKRAAKEALGFAGTRPLALALGTVCQRKRQLDVVQAVAALQARGVGLDLAVVGPGEQPYAGQVQQAAARVAGVRVVGEVDETAPYLRAADILVMASTNESFSLVVLEAMAHGLAIVATPVFARELARPGAECLLFAPGDVAGLASHLGRLVLDPQARLQLAQAARRRFEALEGFGGQVAAYRKAILEAASSAST